MSWAIQIIVAAALTAGSVLFVTETRERHAQEPPPPVNEVTNEGDSVGHLSNSLRIVGACSVVTSLVGGATLITITRLKRRHP